MIPSRGLRLLGVAGVALVCLCAGCGSSATTSLSPSSVPKCKVAVTPGQLAVDEGGGAGSMTVSTGAECAWTASAAANWISVLAPSSGQGNGEVKFQVAPNPASTARQTDISLNDAIARVTQAGASCRIELAPAGQTVRFEGGNGIVTIATVSGCPWTVSTNASWLTASPREGAGPGTVSFSASANTGAAREGNLSIGGQTFVVTQPPVGVAPQCTYAVQPGSASIGTDGGPLTAAVTSGPACSWTATSHASWLTVGGSGTGSGNGSLTIVVSANTGAARAGTVTIADQTFAVVQAGPGAPPPPPPPPVPCAYALDPGAQSVAAAAGTASVAVQTTTGCAWTATTNTPWLNITAGTSGAGSGTVDFTVALNNGAPRTGTISIAGLTHTVNQTTACEMSIDPTSATFDHHKQTSDPVSVTAPAGCAWTATSNDSWIKVKSGAAGTGDGAVRFEVSDHRGNSSRVGTLTIAGQTFTVTQTAR